LPAAGDKDGQVYANGCCVLQQLLCTKSNNQSNVASVAKGFTIHGGDLSGTDKQQQHQLLLRLLG
jgi:hypothetical protein